MGAELPFDEIRPAEWAKETATKIAKIIGATVVALLLQGAAPASAEEPKEKPRTSDTETKACMADAKAAAARMCGDMGGCTGGMLQGLEEEFSKDCPDPDDK